MEALRHSFRPEFLNRIDETIIFNPLRKQDIEKIIDIQIALIKDRLEDERNIKLEIDPAAREYLAKEGFSAEFGARPLKRLLQKVILDRLADKIIRGEYKDGGKVKVNFKANSLVFTP
jgi:ATP-dependent Clp protease ATP-binding subunit ClpA